MLEIALVIVAFIWLFMQIWGGIWEAIRTHPFLSAVCIVGVFFICILVADDPRERARRMKIYEEERRNELEKLKETVGTVAR